MSIRCMNCMKEYDGQLPACPGCGFVKGTPPKEIYHLHPEVELSDHRYVIGTVVAYGGFGIIYRAWDRKLEVMVAIKEYFPTSSVNRNPGEKEVFIYTKRGKDEFKAGVTGFLDEARNTSKFSSHPNIVNVFDYFEENGTAYMVMEFMDGVSLKQYTKEMGGRLSWEKAVEIGCCITDVLKVVHEAGILHRDISPDNIMLCREGNIKLFDFGAARFSDQDKEVTRTIVLKIGFAPPEQYRSKSKQGPWTDIYALGATLYRCITGVVPVESENRKEALIQKEKDPLKNPKELVEDLPDYVAIALMKAMSLEPELRFQSVMQFKAALQNKKKYHDVEEELILRKKRRKLGIAAVLTAVFAAVIGCFQFYQKKQEEANLSAVTLTMWVPEEGEAGRDLYADMIAEFQQDYPLVDIKIEGIPKDQYRERLEAANSGEEEFPVLYESSGLEELPSHPMEDLTAVYNLISRDDYYLLDEESLKVLGTKQLPLGFYCSVVYENSNLQNSRQSIGKENSQEDFFNQKTSVWVSDTESYTKVQEALPGLYTMAPVNVSPPVARYASLWSVDGGASEGEKNAAKRLLYYFLGENAQDILHIQNMTALPLNKNEFQIFLEVNQEFDFLSSQLSEGEAPEMLSAKECQAAYDRIYETIKTGQDSEQEKD